MHISLLKCCLFLLLITGIEGLKKLWKPDDSVINHKIMKKILESCYKNENLENPIVIIGDFQESIDESSIIKLDEFYKFDEEFQYQVDFRNTNSVASKIIIIENSPKKLEFNLHLLQNTRWWDHMALFFIIEKNVKTCENAMNMLLATWRMNILNSIYICTESNNTAAFYTFNSIANYAPSPWKWSKEREHFYMFHQMFDSNIACETLHYDKTKNLHGYEITIIAEIWDPPHSSPRRIYFGIWNEEVEMPPQLRMLYNIFTSWNVTAHLDYVKNYHEKIDRVIKGTGDIAIKLYTSPTFIKHFIPTNFWDEIIGVVKFRHKVSTLTEICQSGSSPVMVLAATALGILLIIAALDLKKLLTYTSISANNKSYKCRIYFTSILIFIIIAYGVFQGFAVTFLIKPKRFNPPQTLDELQKLEYKIFAEASIVNLISEICPKCESEGKSLIPCIEFAKNKPDHACLLPKFGRRSRLNGLNLYFVKTPVLTQQPFIFHRPNWPLRNRLTETLLRTFETGLQNFWIRANTEKERFEQQIRQIEWFLPQYRPLGLNDLIFAFKVLGLGLSISTIVFFIELIVAEEWKILDFFKLSRVLLKGRNAAKRNPKVPIPAVGKNLHT